MPAPRKYPNELRERAIRLVCEARQEEPGLLLTSAVNRIGVHVDTLRGWGKQTDMDAGRRPGPDDRGRGPGPGAGAGEPSRVPRARGVSG
jgi:transposase-like protein